jgi:hypothetical protein
MMTRLSLASIGLTTLAALGLASGTQAQTIAAAKTTLDTATASPVTTSVSNAVVTKVLTTGATTSSFLIQDSTGAVEVYSLPLTTYTPTVGDVISDSARIVSFHGLAELETSTAFSFTGGGTLPAPTVFTTPDLTNGSTVGLAEQSTLGTLSGVTFTAPGTFASNGTYTVTNAAGSATIFVPSTDTAIIGTAIPTGTVNIYGYLGQYDASVTSTGFGPSGVSTNDYELDPLTISAAPEPSEFVSLLLGVGVLGAIVARRRVRA